ncbi:MAG: pentapeptide repeat-containing protein [Coleofasciculus sp. G1-WW12-02]|uniref:pentapeptide repeat-containing protein n=1 Tax=Coleofasciculus sp. G1-WW12-02 TaxID=3068483 RepID=UPI003300DD11
MTGRILPEGEQFNLSGEDISETDLSVQSAQEVIYQFLIKIVHHNPPETVLQEFRKLFLENQSEPHLTAALKQIIESKNDQEFRNTLKRSCYILINNWSSKRSYEFIENLIQLVGELPVKPINLSPYLSRLKGYIANFVDSHDYQELKLFSAPYIAEAEEKRHWSHRYTSYLLVPQYLDSRNPIEQRETAKNLSRRLRKDFKFELAMYTARCDSSHLNSEKKITNPTRLGEHVIQLIKKLSSRQILVNCRSYANYLNQQAQTQSYQEFKGEFKQYLLFIVNVKAYSEILDKYLFSKLDSLYENHHTKPLSFELLLRTCRRIIELLTTEDGQKPSILFILLTNRGNPLTIVVILLKIILICKYAQTHLDVCIAQLIRYYENSAEKDCQWLINFLEVFNIVFAICTEDIQYNIVKLNANDDEQDAYVLDLDDYRLFSQLKGTDLRSADLRGTDIRYMDLRAADLREVDLAGADLSKADLSLAKLNQTNLSGAMLERTELSGAILQNANLSGANLSHANLRCADLQKANLCRAILKSAKLRRANLQQVDLSSADLSNASLNSSNLVNANLRYANLSNADLSKAHLNGVDLRNANLRGAQLNWTQLHHADLSGANLDRADLSYASLCHANLQKTDLTRTDLSNSNLSRSDMRQALLRHVNLTGANLSHANLRGANLFNANLTGVKVKGTRFGNNSGLSDPMKQELKQQGAIIG